MDLIRQGLLDTRGGDWDTYHNPKKTCISKTQIQDLSRNFFHFSMLYG